MYGGEIVNKQIEEAFVKNYIVSHKRERLLFELHGKKRQEGIGRFCHCADTLLIPSTVKAHGKYITQQLQQQIAISKCSKCYVISIFEELDGIVLDKEEVLEAILGLGMPSIAIFDDFVIVETEQVQGPAIKYLLQK